jgi:hypothetical protein
LLRGSVLQLKHWSVVYTRVIVFSFFFNLPGILEVALEEEDNDDNNDNDTLFFFLPGILEVASEEEEMEDDPNDEVLMTLKQAQANLKPLLQWKVRHLKEVLKKAKDQQARQQLWKKFEECDAKVRRLLF